MNGVEFKKPLYPNLEVELALVGWSYRDLSKYIGVSDDQMSKKMRGVIEFKLDEVVRTAQLFNKSVEHLFFKNECE